MLVFGSRGYRFKRGAGTFRCPHCGGDRAYTRRELKRMGHVFWIPVLPLGSAGEYIQCNSCGGEFDMAVLSLPTSQQVEQRLDVALRSAIAAMIRSDSNATAEELRMGATIAARHLQGDYTEADMRRDLAEMHDDRLESHLSKAAQYLTEDGRVSFVQACLVLAVADGELNDDELATLVRVAAGLGIPDAYVPGIVEQAFRAWQSRNA